MGRCGRGRPDYHQIEPGCPEKACPCVSSSSSSSSSSRTKVRKFVPQRPIVGFPREKLGNGDRGPKNGDRAAGAVGAWAA
eukprot:1931539-Prymnesium_polylepis.1